LYKPLDFKEKWSFDYYFTNLVRNYFFDMLLIIPYWPRIA